MEVQIWCSAVSIGIMNSCFPFPSSYIVAGTTYHRGYQWLQIHKHNFKFFGQTFKICIDIELICNAVLVPGVARCVCVCVCMCVCVCVYSFSDSFPL